jgi:hypothetical protein
MKTREFIKRAAIYTLGFGLYAYEFVVATIEGLGLNTKGFWGEPTRPTAPDDHIASAPVIDPIAKARADMLTRAAADFDRWNKMTPAERAAKAQARDDAWAAREKAAQAALATYHAEWDRRWKEWGAAVDAWAEGSRHGEFPQSPEPPPYPKEAEPIPQNLVGAPFEKESLS